MTIHRLQLETVTIVPTFYMGQTDTCCLTLRGGKIFWKFDIRVLTLILGPERKKEKQTEENFIMLILTLLTFSQIKFG